jgi:hypothetical protein
MQHHHHDVTRDPLPPKLRAWVDQAAERVIAEMNDESERGESRSRRVGEDGLTSLGRAALHLMRDGSSDLEVSRQLNCSRAYAWEMRRRFEASGILAETKPWGWAG